MPKRHIRIGFSDSWEAMPLEDALSTRLLRDKYEVEVCPDPEYRFAGANGFRHLQYDCVKIQSIGENIHPDFNFFDYALGFDFLAFGDRYPRCPLYAFYAGYEKVGSLVTVSREALSNRGFCSFVVSNSGGNQLRREFFEELSKYKPVASDGRWLNNIGEPNGVKDKAAFCAKYKFNIAFENSDAPAI